MAQAQSSSKIAGSKKKSKNGKGVYLTYRNDNRAQKNRIARLERHLRTHPNDETALAALNASSSFTGRKQPRRNRPITMSIFGDKKSTKSKGLLTKTDNRLTSEGRLMQQLLSEIRHFMNVLVTNPEIVNKIGLDEE